MRGQFHEAFMDLNKKIDQVDEELRLLKNEIKQVLLGIQEHVLTVQNPFAGLIGEMAPTQQREKTELTTEGSIPLESTAGAPDAQEMPRQSPAPGGDGLSIPAAAVQGTEGTPMSDLQLPAGAGPLPALRPSTGSGNGLMREDSSADEGEQVYEDVEIEPDVDGDKDLRRRPEIRRSKVGAKKSKRDESDRADEDNPDAQDRGERGGLSPGPDSRTPRPPDDATSKAAPRLDLVTIAGLATWTEHVVSKLGSEQLELLLEVWELRGDLPGEVKEIVLSLARLFDGSEDGRRLTAREMVSLLAQLDALSGSGTSSDTKLLRFLIQGDLEDFPLMRQ